MKKITVIISCICTFCAFGILTYFIFTHRSVADYLETGQAAMRAGNIEIAKKNFLEVIARDEANETAYKALAEIAEKHKEPTWAAKYWKIAAKLNPLSKELHEKYINALLNAHQYHTIIEQLENKKVTNLSNFELYALTKASYFKNTIIETKRLLAVLLKRSPKDPKVILLNARILLSSGNIKDAKKNFVSLENCSDKKIRTNALIGLGHSAIALKQLKDASVFYQKAVESSPDSMEVLMIFANYNLSFGKQKLAQAQYEKLHKNLPGNIIVAITLAEIYAKDKNTVAINKILNHIKTNNQVAIAGKYYLRAILAYIANDSEKLKQNLRLCKMFNSRSLYAYMQFQEILASNDVRRIDKHVDTLLKINDSLTARTDLCEQIEQITLKKFNNKKFKTAASLAAIMQKLLPEKPAITHLTMVCAFNLQKWRKAISKADKFNSQSPNSLDYLSIKGRSLLYLHEAKEALSLLTKLTGIVPEKPEAWLWAAQAYQLLGKQKKVEVCIEKMLQLAGNSHLVIDPAVTFFLAQNNIKIANKIAYHLQLSQDKTFKAMAWSIKAQTAQKNKEWEHAVKYLIKAYDLGKDIDMLLYISDIYQEHKKYDKALEYVTKALKDAPDSAKALFRQALIFQKLADYKQAVRIYKKLLKEYPHWSLVLVKLSDILAIQGKKQEALSLAQQAQAKSPLWPPAKLCLGLRELDCKNYAPALTIFELLLAQEPDNKIVKDAIPRCLVPIIREHIDEKCFTMAKLRLKQLKRAAPNSKETVILEKLLISKEKTKNLLEK